MSNLQLFQFESRQVRVIYKDGEPWFVAKDVLAAMGSKTTVTALEALVSEDLGKEFVTNQHLQTPGGKQEMLCLSEPALTLFVSRSRTELGKAMNRWIHTEVLPSIRKTGGYSLAPKPEAPVFKLYSERRDKNAVMNLPENYWCVFRESMNFLIDFEKAVNRLGIEIAVSQYDLLDGSIGTCWSNYRKGKEWTKPTKTYLHYFRDKRGKQEANCYHRDELWEFRTWLDKVYSPEKMPDYLKRKYGTSHDLVLRSDDIVGLLPAMM